MSLSKREDGRREYVRWVVAPWHEESGAVGGIVIYSEDVTRQVETLGQLEEQELMARDLFERSPVGLNLCRMDGLWLESNPAFLAIIGYSREEANGGLTYWQLTPRKYDADEARQLELLRSTKKYGPYEKEFIRKDGSLVPVRLNGFIVERDGQELIWSLIEDISAQRALEAKLEEERLNAIQSSKLATLGEMSATLAHEINNPLQIIGAFVELLDDAIARRSEGETREALDAIRGASARAAKIVKSLQRFAHESGSEPVDRVSLSAILEDALTLCRARIVAYGARLTVDVTSHAEVAGHALELSQVLVNLLNNALDAARAASGANPEVGWIRLSVVDGPDDRTVEIRVEDSGAGVAADAREAIFRSFFTTKKLGEGTGLGLSISRSIVERHGGTLTYDTSAPCTRFVVRLPKLAS